MASTACWASETVSQLEATVRVPALVFGLTGGGWTLLPSVDWYGHVASVAWKRLGRLFSSVACGGHGNGFWFIGCLGMVMVWFGYDLVNHGNLVMVNISPTTVKLVWFGSCGYGAYRVAADGCEVKTPRWVGSYG